MKTVTDNDITICGHGSGRPSTKNLDVYSQTRYNQKARNHVRKGIVEVRRFKLMTDNDRKKFVKAYKTILGRNFYSMSKRDHVFRKYKDGKYYSDCSSSGMASYIKIGLNPGGLLNTAGIHSSSKFKTVPVTIKSGHIVDPWKLQVGDCILFAGSDPSRPKQIGHVEYVYKVPGVECAITTKCSIYQKKDQLAKRLKTHFASDRIRILDDCKDGWSLCTDGNVIGYIKNSAIKKVGKSSYPVGTINKDCKIYSKNKKLSKVAGALEAETSVKIVTMRKRWTYINTTDTKGAKLRGWIPTKYISYK